MTMTNQYLTFIIIQKLLFKVNRTEAVVGRDAQLLAKVHLKSLQCAVSCASCSDLGNSTHSQWPCRDTINVHLDRLYRTLGGSPQNPGTSALSRHATHEEAL